MPSTSDGPTPIARERRGAAIGGISGPLLFGYLVGTEDEGKVAIGFLIGAVWLIAAAVTEFAIGVDAEQKPLEEIAEPLSSEEAGGAGPSDEHRDDVEDHDADEPTHRERRETGGYPARARLGWAPFYAYSPSDDPLERQIASIERAVADTDRPLRERELLERSQVRHWGPGVARRALRMAVSEGRIERRNGGYVARTRAGRE